ncbi:50S ribosomal protein L17 [Candidatus Fermentibacterales bacterium]|nr:50S ribosomal protein L17 [Candidatus Fermentibacterales bacterium]
MRHRKTTPRLSRSREQRRRLIRNMVTSLILEERVRTSLAKARAVRSRAEKVITKGREDSVHSRRQVARMVYGSKAVQKVFDELGPRYSDRPGGYTRILKLGHRFGDAAEECILELVGSKAFQPSTDKK